MVLLNVMCYAGCSASLMCLHLCQEHGGYMLSSSLSGIALSAQQPLCLYSWWVVAEEQTTASAIPASPRESPSIHYMLGCWWCLSGGSARLETNKLKHKAGLMKLVSKNILTQACHAVEMEAGKVHSRWGETPGSMLLRFVVALL